MDESPFGLLTEGDEEIWRGHSKSIDIRDWEIRFRERLQITLSQLETIQSASDQENEQ